MNPLRLSLACLAIASAAGAQSTGRVLRVIALPVVGSTATFELDHPPAALGNLYAFLWCMPQYPGTYPLAVPGFTLHGALRVDPAHTVTVVSGVLGVGGSVQHSLVVPNDPGLAGMAWDLQTVDLALSTSDVFLSDNDVELSISLSPPSSLNMVPIAPGTFLMGSNVTAGFPFYPLAPERPVHQVTISRPFWIGQYEVTQAEYQAVMGVNPSLYQGASYPNSANCPVESVSWNDATAYCTALTAQEAAAGRLPFGYQYRLPTEAEWEYCCRAGSTTEFGYGNSLVCGLAQFAHSYHTSSSCNSAGTVPVGSYPPNALGLYDMHGNVWEWCLDSWYGTANYPSSPVVDPYVQSGNGRITRGGGHGSTSEYCRSAYRVRQYPYYMRNDFGFRVVLAP